MATSRLLKGVMKHCSNGSSGDPGAVLDRAFIEQHYFGISRVTQR